MSSSLRPLIELLADGRFHSGQALGRELGLSRTAVWKRIRALEALGLECHAVGGKGYRLARPLELLERQALLDAIPPAARPLLGGLELLEETDSTNAHLMARVGRLPCGHVCLAERQLAGRGRRGRAWISPYGRNLYLSIHWSFPLPATRLGALPLALGCAVAEALSRLGLEDVGLKWPNDLLWRQRKLGGLLLEMGGEAEGPCHVVAGVGINIDMGGAGEEIDQPWCDVATALGAPIGRNRLGGEVIAALLEALASYQRDGFAPFAERWRRFDLCEGQPVRLLLPNGTVEGTARGVDEQGALRLEQEGRITIHHGGEVSLRLGGEPPCC